MTTWRQSSRRRHATAGDPDRGQKVEGARSDVLAPVATRDSAASALKAQGCDADTADPAELQHDVDPQAEQQIEPDACVDVMKRRRANSDEGTEHRCADHGQPEP